MHTFSSIVCPVCHQHPGELHEEQGDMNVAMFILNVMQYYALSRLF